RFALHRHDRGYAEGQRLRRVLARGIPGRQTTRHCRKDPGIHVAQNRARKSEVSFLKARSDKEMIRSIPRLCSAAMAFVPLAASADVVVGDGAGFLHGFSHPFSGIDHVLAMVAVGMFAAHLGGRGLWLVPLTFISVMALAGIAGMAGVGLPFVEIGIGV